MNGAKLSDFSPIETSERLTVHHANVDVSVPHHTHWGKASKLSCKTNTWWWETHGGEENKTRALYKPGLVSAAKHVLIVFCCRVFGESAS
jgi:hypothetical protein